MTVRSVAWRELILSLCVTQSQSAAAWSIVNTLWHNFGVRYRIFGLLLAATFEATSPDVSSISCPHNTTGLICRTILAAGYYYRVSKSHALSGGVVDQRH